MTAPALRVVVGDGDPRALLPLLERLGHGAALAEGRVFVNARRQLNAAEPLTLGAVVEVWSARPRAAIEILAEGPGWVAVSKPAALASEPDHAGADSVLVQLAQRCGSAPPALSLLSRLDVGVSGVLLASTNAEARAGFLRERERGRYVRRYVALANGVPTPARGAWTEALGTTGRGRRGAGGSGARAARSEYAVLASAGSVSAGGSATSLLALSPVTGRTHQLRVHASLHGAPLLGDRKYGGPPRLLAEHGRVVALGRIFLHAAWVEWGEPGRRQRVECPFGAEFTETWAMLGGEPAAWDRALLERL